MAWPDPPPPTVRAWRRDRHAVGACRRQLLRRTGQRWYVPRALGEETAISAHPPRQRRGAQARHRPARQRPSPSRIGRLGAAVTTRSARTSTSPRASSRSRSSPAKFPTEQRLAQTSDLRLEIENTGDEADPRPRGDDLHRRREGQRLVLGPLRAARPRRPQPARSGSSRTATRSSSPATSTARRLDAAPPGRRGGGADQHLLLRRAAGRARARDIVWRVTPVAGRHLHGPLRARRRPHRQGRRR